MMTRLRHTLSILLVLGLLGPAHAAPSPDTTDAPTPETLVQTELAQSLTSDRAYDQERAARRIRTYAYTDRYDAAFFRDLVSPLQDLAADGRTESLRITAISALSAIGTDAAMRGLKAQVISFRPGPIRQLTVHVIAQYDAGWAVAEADRPTQ